MRLLSFLLLILLSCDHKKNIPDVSAINTTLTVHRFDKDFFSIDTNQLQTSLQAINQKYPAFLPLYFKFFAPVKDIAQQQSLSFDKALLQYYRFIKPLYTSVQQKFADVSTIKRDLEKNINYVKYYFPSFKTPAVLTTVESLNPENPNEIYGTTYYRDTLIISLQMFLGKDYPAYDPAQYPDYLRRRFETSYIVPNCMRAITAELYLDSSESATLIEQMIEKGKQWWLMKKILPAAPDSLISGYTPTQTTWVETNEGNIWGSINQNENLFTIERPAIQNYIGEAPFTQTLPHGSAGEGAPGNIGPWVGWRILQKFENQNPSLSVTDILRTTAKKIFQEAKYKPK